MRQSHAKFDDPEPKALRYILKAQGLEISGSQAEEVREALTEAVPWLAAAHLSDGSTWDQVEQLVQKQELNLGTVPPLGTYPTLSALKACFPLTPAEGKPHKKSCTPKQADRTQTSWGPSVRNVRRLRNPQGQLKLR